MLNVSQEDADASNVEANALSIQDYNDTTKCYPALLLHIFYKINAAQASQALR